MNYTNNYTHSSAECRANRILIESYKVTIINKLFEKMISILNKDNVYSPQH